LRNKDTGSDLGSITEEQFEFLVNQLEEESDEDTDYYISTLTIDMLEEGGADADLVRLLRKAVGSADGVEVQWSSK
jgi:hypothetical protein